MLINALHPLESKEGEESTIRNQEAWQLTKWLEEGVFDALEKRYLRGLVFAIYDHPEDKPHSRLLETYSCTLFSMVLFRCFQLPRQSAHSPGNQTQGRRTSFLHRRSKEPSSTLDLKVLIR